MKPIFVLLLIVFPLWGASPGETYRKAELLGDFEPSQHGDFEVIPSKMADQGGRYLRRETLKAYRKMWRAAQKDGIELRIISATRNRLYQKKIWQRKWLTFRGSAQEKVLKIMEYSSMPGTSRHHWGTDFDLNALQNDYFESGEGAEIYAWLQENAGSYGFFQPYTAFNPWRDTGYREEKWHWSYYPLANRFQRAYSYVVSYQDLKGFPGWEWAEELDIINRYVMGVEVPEDWRRP